MEAPTITICSSANVHIGQEVVVFHRTLLGHNRGSNDGTVTAVNHNAQTYTVTYRSMGARQTVKIWDQWYEDGLIYCSPAAEVYAR